MALSCNEGLDNPSPTELLRVEPADIQLTVAPGAPVQRAFRVYHRLGSSEEDVTERATVTVVDPGLGSVQPGVFTSSASRGGVTQLSAKLVGLELAASARVEIHLVGSVIPAGLPAKAAASFVGVADAARAPQVVYPNDGVLVPPNLGVLEVHYRPGSAKNTLFEIAFTSAYTDLRTYARCPNPTDGGCILQLDPTIYSYVVESSRGATVQLTVRGGDDAASGFGQAAPLSLTIAESNVEGGLYYWTTSNGTAIMRVDFGSAAQKPEVFLSPTKDNLANCVGCHALSRDGSKLVSSLGGQFDGRLVYQPDLSRPGTFAYKGDGANRLQFASFNPDGSRFVSVYGDVDGAARNQLRFHDGQTGTILGGETLQLGFEPDHPDWSPDGSKIAIDHVGIHGTSQRPYNCGIDVIARAGAGWGAPVTVVPIAAGKSRYNANFAPDSSLFVYSESICPGGNAQSGECDGDADDVAKTWAAAPVAGAAPVWLRRAGAPGPLDRVSGAAKTDLADTYPRFAPFPQRLGQRRIFWVTISSRRRIGLRSPTTDSGGTLRQLLWMFAVDPDQILKGEDGSFPAFVLPFQDLTTSNHIGQWTTKVVPPLG